MLAITREGFGPSRVLPLAAAHNLEVAVGKYQYIVVSQQDKQVQTSSFHDLTSALQVFGHLCHVMQFWGGEETRQDVVDQPGVVIMSQFDSKHKLVVSIVRVW